MDSTYRCVVHELPTAWDPELTVSFEKVNRYTFQELTKEVEETDLSETRVTGVVTMLGGALLAGAVALGGTDEDGNYVEPNPEAGKGILIGSLVLGGVLSLVQDSKEEISSEITTELIEENEAIDLQDTVYSIWSSIFPEKVIARPLKDEEIQLDVVTDLGLDYVENKDSIQVFFKSHWDENLVYTVDFPASDYLERYLKVSELTDSIALYQAPTKFAPVVGYLAKGDEAAFVEEKEQWYKVSWNDRQVYLKSDEISYFFAGK